jgi:hypothetical protein
MSDSFSSQFGVQENPRAREDLRAEHHYPKTLFATFRSANLL